MFWGECYMICLVIPLFPLSIRTYSWPAGVTGPMKGPSSPPCWTAWHDFPRSDSTAPLLILSTSRVPQRASCRFQVAETWCNCGWNWRVSQLVLRYSDYYYFLRMYFLFSLLSNFVPLNFKSSQKWMQQVCTTPICDWMVLG